LEKEPSVNLDLSPVNRDLPSVNPNLPPVDYGQPRLPESCRLTAVYRTVNLQVNRAVNRG